MCAVISALAETIQLLFLDRISYFESSISGNKFFDKAQRRTTIIKKFASTSTHFEDLNNNFLLKNSLTNHQFHQQPE